MKMCVQQRENQRQELGLKQAHHEIQGNFFTAPRSLSLHLTKIPYSIDYLQQLAPKAGITEPITVQTDSSADNHSCGKVFELHKVSTVVRS